MALSTDLPDKRSVPAKITHREIADHKPANVRPSEFSGTSFRDSNRESGRLKETYYIDNFNYVVNFVASNYEALLLHEESQFLHTYQSLSTAEQQLFVRLVLRTHSHIRFSKIQYREIDCGAALEKLDQVGLINRDVDSVEQYLPLYTIKERQAAIGSRTADLPPADSDHWTTSDMFGDSPLSKLQTLDRVISVNFKPTIAIFKLLFFGNLYQDFSSFILRDLGYQRFEPYPVERTALLFRTREQIDAHFEYYQCSEAFDAACEQGVDALIALHASLPQRLLNDSVLIRRLDRLNNKIARQLERESALELAAEIYSTSAHPPARERLARIYAKSGNTTQAIDLCAEILQSPKDSDELDFAYAFGNTLTKKLDTVTSRQFPTVSAYRPPETVLTLTKSNLSVEFSVALHMAKTGKCYYLENNLISGMFGLAFWDVIFAPINGVFFHPFQSKPADFYDADFVSSRETLITQRLAEINNGNLKSIVCRHLYQKRGIQNPTVNWRMCRKHVIDLACVRIPAMTWNKLFKQILLDIRNYKSGQPDLVYFPDSGGYQLIEVKAPGDKLQKNQLRWMRFFNEQNIPHLVVNVEWVDQTG